jgi:hypothetical protein
MLGWLGLFAIEPPTLYPEELGRVNWLFGALGLAKAFLALVLVVVLGFFFKHEDENDEEDDCHTSKMKLRRMEISSRVWIALSNELEQI